MTSDALEVVFPTPDGAAAAVIERGRGLAGEPWWDVQTLAYGVLRSSPQYAQHLRDTVGSSYDWGDELRFDRRTGRLASFVLKTGEDGVIDPAVAASWRARPRERGLPVVVDRERGFHVDPLRHRWLAPDASLLIVLAEGAGAARDDAARVAIHADIELLFAGGRYVGWALAQPIAHLVAAPGEATRGGDAAPAMVRALSAYMALVVEPNLDRMADGDAAMRAALEGLRAQVDGAAGSAEAALRARIEQVIETFYG